MLDELNIDSADEDRAAILLTLEQISALVDFFSDHPPDYSPFELAWDLRRTLGSEGFAILQELMLEHEPPECLIDRGSFETGSSYYAKGFGHYCPRGTLDQYEKAIVDFWQSVNRPHFTQFDRLLIDEYGRAHKAGFVPPDAVLARTFDRLACEEKEARKARQTGERAESDREHAEWLNTDEGKTWLASDDRKRAMAAGEWREIEQRIADLGNDASEADYNNIEAARIEWHRKHDNLFPKRQRATSTGMPLLSAQAVMVELGRPIVDGFNAGQQGRKSIDAPTLPDIMSAHPLFSSLNDAASHVVALAERPGTFRASAVADVLAVFAMVHNDTAATVCARVRGMGCALPEGSLEIAKNRFEASVRRELRIGSGWRLNPKGDPDPQNADNITVLLRMAGSEVRFNIWRQRIEIKSSDGDWQAFTDAELNRLRAVASGEEYRFRPTKDFARDMISDLARQTSYNPVLDFIDSQVWDGTPRLGTWLSRACGVECNLYHQSIGRNVIGGIVKRARNPGAKHDEVMILIGKQGCGKSNLTKVLALQPEWHTDAVTFDGRPQDLVPQLFGKLVIELSELDGMHRRDVGYVKRFLSTQTDNFTAKYQAFAEDHARRCIFIGTCNLENPLVDDTGNRRFYPIRVPDDVQVDIEWLRENIRQLIAEAAHFESKGDTFAIPREVWAVAAAVQEQARTVGAIEELLLRWFNKVQAAGLEGYYVLSSDIVAALTMARQNANAKVGGVMSRLGYVQRRPYINGTQGRAWIMSATGEIDGCAQLVPWQSTNGGPVEMRPRLGPPLN